MIPSLAVCVGTRLVIVAPRHATLEGVLYEQDSPTVLTDASPVSVGAAIKSAFEVFSVRQKDLRDWKKSDWPAFKASGAKSLKQFEAEFYQLSVSHLNSSGVVARAELPFPGDADFSISTTFNPPLSESDI